MTEMSKARYIRTASCLTISLGPQTWATWSMYWLLTWSSETSNPAASSPLTTSDAISALIDAVAFPDHGLSDCVYTSCDAPFSASLPKVPPQGATVDSTLKSDPQTRPRSRHPHVQESRMPAPLKKFITISRRQVCATVKARQLSQSCHGRCNRGTDSPR